MLLILGLGPAAAAAAIAARAVGTEVTMIGRTQASDLRPGETLPPEAAPILGQLGLGDLSALGHSHSPGIISAWATADPHETDFIFNPYGGGWHLDRAAFDRQLLSCADERGARIVRDARLRSVQRDGAGWLLTADHGDGEIKLKARFLVDATGRSAWLARRLGIQRMKFDNLVAIIGFFRNASPGDARTILEAAEDGWWYGARLPGNRSIAAYMTDADIAARHVGGPHKLWSERLYQSSLVRAVAITRLAKLRVVVANTERLATPSGPGWIAIGDAAGSWDPLSSQGVMTALDSSMRGVQAAISIKPHSLIEYVEWFDSLWNQYLQHYYHYYRQVERWPHNLFWKRRQLLEQ